MRIWLEAGRVRRFEVQYQTTIGGELLPVVRYDTAHGFAHRDQVFRYQARSRYPCHPG